MKVYRGLALTTAVIIGGEQLIADHRNHNRYHVEQHSYVAPQNPTRPIVDSGSEGGTTSTGTMSLVGINWV
jgi:hypothetical protein